MPIPQPTISDGGLKGRYLIVGRPATGKSFAANTFPNPVFLDFDHKAPAGAKTFDFWNPIFCDSIVRRVNPNHLPNRRDALLKFFKDHVVTPTESNRLPLDTTLILDSVTAFDESLHQQIRQEGIPVGKSGQPDAFYVWRKKIEFLDDLFTVISAWPGDFICIMHEMPEYDDAGSQTGRVKPLIAGQYADKIASKFNCVFRSRIELDPSTKKPIYVWDVQPTRAFESTNRLGITQVTIKATYQSLMEAAKITKTQNQTTQTTL